MLGSINSVLEQLFVLNEIKENTNIFLKCISLLIFVK